MVYANTYKDSSKRAAYRYRNKGRKGKAKAMGKRMRKTVKAIVKKEIAKENETKFLLEDILIGSEGAANLFNSTINTANDWYRCVPKSLDGPSNQGNSEGFGSANRIGNRITPRSLVGRWSISFSQTDEASRDITVFLYVLQPRYQRQYPVATPNNQLQVGFNDFLRQGVYTTYGSGFPGTYLGSIRPVDTNQHKVLMIKKFRLNKPSGAAQGSGVVGQAGRGLYSVGDAEFRKEITYKFKNLPKQFVYSGPPSELPENYAPVWAIGYYYNDNASPDTEIGLLRVDFNAQLYYDDS